MTKKLAGVPTPGKTHDSSQAGIPIEGQKWLDAMVPIEQLDIKDARIAELESALGNTRDVLTEFNRMRIRKDGRLAWVDREIRFIDRVLEGTE